MSKEERPKKAAVSSFRLPDDKMAALERAARDSDCELADLLRGAVDAMIRAHKRSGRVPREMEIQQRYYPSGSDDLSWAVAEAPPGQTINAVMAQASSTAAAYFAGRLSGEIRVHPHFVHERSRLVFLGALRDALYDELQALADPGRWDKSRNRLARSAPDISSAARDRSHGAASA